MLSKNKHLLSLKQNKDLNMSKEQDLNGESKRSSETVDIDWDTPTTQNTTVENNHDTSNMKKATIGEEEDTIVTHNRFEDMGISDDVLSCIFKAGLETPRKPQRVIGELITRQTNFVFKASTGSGKTFTFLIPIADSIKPEIIKTQAMIVAPTRELATQIYKEAKKLFGDSDYSVALHRGTRSKDGAARSEGDKYMTTKPSHCGNEHIVIGTPARLLNLIHERTYCDRNVSIKIDCKFIHKFVLDECDKLLASSSHSESDMSKDVHDIIAMIPPYAKQLLFSATMSTNVQLYADKIEAMFLNFESKKIGKTVRRYYVKLGDANDTGDCLNDILTEIGNAGSTLIFASSIKKVQYIWDFLLEKNYSVDMIHAMLSQKKRDETMDNFRSGHIRILVATNVIGRGIDIPSVDLVFDIDINPEENTEEYVHRSGRAGRDGKDGIAIAFVIDGTNTRPADILRIEREQNVQIDHLPPLEKLF